MYRGTVKTYMDVFFLLLSVDLRHLSVGLFSADNWALTIIRRGGRRAAPRYSVYMWNCHDRAKNGVARTNYSVEGWHCAFQNALRCVHPTIYKLITALRKEQSLTEVSIERYIAGEERPAASKAKYIQLDRRLRALVGRYDQVDEREFLRGVSYNVTF